MSDSFIRYKKEVTYTLKSGVRQVIKEYNNRKQGTIKMTPNEAYL
jgi:hypothetical protein